MPVAFGVRPRNTLLPEAMKRPTIHTLLLALCVSSASASTLYTPEFEKCMDNSGGVTVEMIDCMAAEMKVQDASLNANYKVLISELTEVRKKELLEAQRAWLRFRELNCKFYYDPDGGTLARVSASDCFLSSTAERALELRRLLR